MVEEEQSDALVEELRALPSRRRRAVMAALNPSERAAFDKLLASPAPRTAPPGPGAPGGRGLSPWLEARVQAAERGDAQGMTKEAAAALLAAAAALPAEAGEPAEFEAAERSPPLLTLLARKLGFGGSAR